MSAFQRDYGTGELLFLSFQNTTNEGYKTLKTSKYHYIIVTEVTGMNERMKQKVVDIKPNIFLRTQQVISEILSGAEKKYSKAIGQKRESYGFFIRSIHEHFEPCVNCQIEIKTILFTKGFNLHRQRNHISLEQSIVKGDRVYEFGLHFVKQETVFPFTWKPCPKCQREIAKLFNEAEQLTIGNKDYLEPIELWMKYEMDDNSWKTVEERPSTPEEQERLKDSWFD